MPIPGVPELLIIVLIVVMLFGVGKLPEVFGAVGKGIREFRKETTADTTPKNEAAAPVKSESTDAAEKPL